MTARIIKQEIFCGTGFYKRREINYEEKKEEEKGKEIKRKFHKKQIKAIL
ncbi:MAG: hypothetical protein JW740_00015 [Candidatus Zambryskibacteria bacterium]|nr:hypothetical protein [Candidatus Zambryskibacteria bacterium]